MIGYSKDIVYNNFPWPEPTEQQKEMIKQTAKAVIDARKNVCSFFTVEQLKYLVRGGRLGKFSGIVGSLLNIKPVLRVNETGHLVSYKKVISRKKSIAELVNICQNNSFTRKIFCNIIIS